MPTICLAGAIALAVSGAAHAEAPTSPVTASPETVEWFRATEQALMNAFATGDRTAWELVTDPSCVITDEEGSVTPRKRFLDQMRPLPKGLTGAITVRDLSVQEFPDFAVVRFLVDEWESVFGQRLTTKYRTTDTFRRDAGGWKMVATHTSVVTQDPPSQTVSGAGWGAFAGTYRLLPDGWTLTVELKDGRLWGGRDPGNLQPFIPLTPDAFVLSGHLGEWMFVTEKGRAVRILNFRKFEPLVWTRVEPVP